MLNKNPHNLSSYQLPQAFSPNGYGKPAFARKPLLLIMAVGGVLKKHKALQC